MAHQAASSCEIHSNFDDVNLNGKGHGANGHDTVDRLKSCLDAQFTAAFGGPSPYNGTKTVSGIASRTLPNQTYDCEDMTATHADIGVNPGAFDQFIADVGSVLRKDGVADADISSIATALMGSKPQIVAPADTQKHFNFQPGDPTNQPAVACTVHCCFHNTQFDWSRKRCLRAKSIDDRYGDCSHMDE